ncbi:MAG: deoxyribose-phosphate aldolase [Clostridiales bacterium]|nr:deoxyribose-phosphate aldolase [Clostridiales bacterium]
MDIQNILSKCDHTLLSVTATTEQIRETLDDGIKYGVASACIPPCYVKYAKEYVGDRLKICTVIGFPNGYQTTAVKVAETLDAIQNGADEIDMVINIGKVKEGDFCYVKHEIKEIKKACKDKILKVIIETCLLEDHEIKMMCNAITDAEADFIKTSTGFSTAGATVRDIEIFKEYIGEKVKIKAAGGINGFSDAQIFIDLGVERLGTSRLVKILKSNEKEKGGY